MFDYESHSFEISVMIKNRKITAQIGLHGFYKISFEN